MCKVSCAQGVNFGFVSFPGVSKLMGKEIKGSKRPPETEGESFCGQGLLCTWCVKAESAPHQDISVVSVCLQQIVLTYADEGLLLLACFC